MDHPIGSVFTVRFRDSEDRAGSSETFVTARHDVPEGTTLNGCALLRRELQSFVVILVMRSYLPEPSAAEITWVLTSLNMRSYGRTRRMKQADATDRTPSAIKIKAPETKERWL